MDPVRISDRIESHLAMALFDQADKALHSFFLIICIIFPKRKNMRYAGDLVQILAFWNYAADHVSIFW